MSTGPRVFVSIPSMLLMLLVGCSNADSAAAGSSMPRGILGKWQVTAVVGGSIEDKKGARYASYGAFDDRLMRRFFSIGESAIAANTPEKPRCAVTGATTQRTNLKTLLRATLQGPSWVETSTINGVKSSGADSLESSELGGGISQGAPIDMMQVECSTGPFGKDLGIPGGVQGAWMVLFPNGRLAIRWYDETVLVLTRVAADAKPRPSFDCAKASTAPEKTICSSLELASLDATIAERYRDSIEIASDPNSRLTTPDDVPKLKKRQREWLEQRNACGSDAECLHQSMEEWLKEEYRLEWSEGDSTAEGQ